MFSCVNPFCLFIWSWAFVLTKKLNHYVNQLLESITISASMNGIESFCDMRKWNDNLLLPIETNMFYNKIIWYCSSNSSWIPKQNCVCVTRIRNLKGHISKGRRRRCHAHYLILFFLSILVLLHWRDFCLYYTDFILWDDKMFNARGPLPW